MPHFDAAFRETLADLLTWRRDVRHFLDDSLAEEDVMALLELAQRAPSVGNSQPWRFVRVRSPHLRTALADHADAQGAQAVDHIADAGRHAAYRAIKLHGLREAPEIIAVFCDEGTKAGAGLGAATMPQTRAYSVVLAIHTLWLAARARELALGWVSVVDSAVVTQMVDVPADWQFIALLCLGHPVAPSDSPELARIGWQARIDPRAHISSR